VTWGDARTPAGEPVAWGVACRNADTECDPAPSTAPCSVITPDCDRAAPSRLFEREDTSASASTPADWRQPADTAGARE
jgi:hypothetical protein